MMDTNSPDGLVVEGLHVSYGTIAALHGISLEVGAGETVALIGANGAGKSTTLRAISGLLKARSGSITWRGAAIQNLPPDRIVSAGIAHCPEERHVWSSMTVEENITLGAYLCRSRHEIHQFAGTLSGGEQQMLAIARALMSEPNLLMLDEPSLGLSPKIAEEVFDVVRTINGQGVTVLLVEQNIHNALAVASRAYVVETGRVTASRLAADLRGDPDLLKAYLGGTSPNTA